MALDGKCQLTHHEPCPALTATYEIALSTRKTAGVGLALLHAKPILRVPEPSRFSVTRLTAAIGTRSRRCQWIDPAGAAAGGRKIGSNPSVERFAQKRRAKR